MTHEYRVLVEFCSPSPVMVCAMSERFSSGTKKTTINKIKDTSYSEEHD